MPDKWTGDIIGIMHCNKITRKDVADEIGVTKAYITMILNGKRYVPAMQNKIVNAVNTLIARQS